MKERLTSAAEAWRSFSSLEFIQALSPDAREGFKYVFYSGFVAAGAVLVETLPAEGTTTDEHVTTIMALFNDAREELRKQIAADRKRKTPYAQRRDDYRPA